MVFAQRHKPKLDEASRLGFRSILVLAKLGFDLREQFDEVVNEPLPEEFCRSLKQMEAQPRRPWS